MLRPDGHPFLARLIDPVMAPLDEVRAKLVPQAYGQVLEVGMGTGLNLRHYDPAKVTHVVGIEPDPYMRERAERRIAEVPFSCELLDADAADLPFGDDTFDCAVVTFVLCTIPDVEAAVAELRRVLKPDGVLLFAEHTVSPGPVAPVQRFLSPAWMHVAGGCRLDRDAVGLLEAAGFHVDTRDPKGARWSLFPVYRGRAV